ncbi:hypothetical protein [Paraglaciecola sp.]|uniref:hypothetical protein n=1 Tax=Paraglaciecola sp. TaxID=1920173 RepID=UPI0030F40D77
MKNFVSKIAAVTLCIYASLTVSLVFSSDKKEVQDYQLIVFNDCEVVHQALLNEVHLQSYRELLSKQAGSIEFESKVEFFAKKAEGEPLGDEDFFFIEKSEFQEETDTVQFSEKLAVDHGTTFHKVVSEQENQVGSFVKGLEGELTGLSYDAIRIIKAEDAPGAVDCTKDTAFFSS